MGCLRKPGGGAFFQPSATVRLPEPTASSGPSVTIALQLESLLCQPELAIQLVFVVQSILHGTDTLWNPELRSFSPADLIVKV